MADPWPPPRVSEVDPFAAGLVFASAIAERYRAGAARPPYVQRDRDGDIDQALRDHAFVLILGASKAGKSRTAFEAAARMRPEPSLVRPTSPEALPRLLGEDFGGRPAVLWLDELDTYLLAPGVQPYLFRALAQRRPRVTVLATMTLTRFDALTQVAADPRMAGAARVAAEVLAMARQIMLPSALSAAEAGRAHDAYPHERFEAGIGEHMAAAGELVVKLRNGMEANPHGFAVALAALDARRMGVNQPITEEVLRHLYDIRLPDFHPLLRPSDDGFSAGLDWATRPLSSHAALVLPRGVDPEAWESFDYVRDWVEDPAHVDVDPRIQEIPEEAWQYVLREFPPRVAPNIALAAEAVGDLQAAALAWRSALGSDDPLDVAAGMGNLGLTLDKLGEIEQALAVYAQLDSRFHASPDEQIRAVLAASQVGRMVALSKLGRHEEALALSEEIEHRFANDANVGYRMAVMLAKRHRASALMDLGRPDEALIAMARFEADPDADPYPGMDDQTAIGIMVRAHALQDLKRWDEALAAVAEAEVVLLPHLEARDHDPRMLAVLGMVLASRSLILDEAGRHEEEIESYDRSVRLLGKIADPAARAAVASALAAKGITLFDLTRVGEAQKILDEINRRYPESQGSVLHAGLEQRLATMPRRERRRRRCAGAEHREPPRPLAII